MAFSHLLQIRPGGIDRVGKAARQRLPHVGSFCRAGRQLLPLSKPFSEAKEEGRGSLRALWHQNTVA
jgi:hypothetical protein